jgi:hypothetical protein
VAACAAGARSGDRGPVSLLQAAAGPLRRSVGSCLVSPSGPAVEAAGRLRLVLVAGARPRWGWCGNRKAEAKARPAQRRPPGKEQEAQGAVRRCPPPPSLGRGAAGTRAELGERDLPPGRGGPSTAGRKPRERRGGGGRREAGYNGAVAPGSAADAARREEGKKPQECSASVLQFADAALDGVAVGVGLRAVSASPTI